MSFVKYTKNTGDAIRKASRIKTKANSRRTDRPGGAGGAGAVDGTFNPSFTNTEGETVQIVTCTKCYYQRGILTFNAGVYDEDLEEKVLFGNMPAGLIAFISFQLNDNAPEALQGSIITGSTMESVTDQTTQKPHTLSKILIYSAERTSTESSWFITGNLINKPQVQLRV